MKTPNFPGQHHITFVNTIQNQPTHFFNTHAIHATQASRPFHSTDHNTFPLKLPRYAHLYFPSSIPYTNPLPSRSNQAKMSAPNNQVETEQDLRKRAIEWMEAKYRDQPSGSLAQPPPFYQCNIKTGTKSTFASASGSKAPERPCVWIKDWVTGKVRAPKWTDDMVKGQVEVGWP